MVISEKNAITIIMSTIIKVVVIMDTSLENMDLRNPYYVCIPSILLLKTFHLFIFHISAGTKPLCHSVFFSVRHFPEPKMDRSKAGLF